MYDISVVKLLHNRSPYTNTLVARWLTHWLTLSLTHLLILDYLLAYPIACSLAYSRLAYSEPSFWENTSSW